MLKMKKLLGVITAGVMVCAMGITTFAAGSPSSSGVVQGVTNAVDKDGTAVRVEVQELSEEGKTAAAQIQDEAGLKAVMGSEFEEGMELLDVQEAVVIGDESLVVWPVTLTFSIPGVVPTTKIKVLHFKGSWEVVPSKAGNGTVEATFESLSPVAFVVDKSTMDTSTGTTGAAAGTGATSPKTGESSAVMGLGLVALLAAGGAFGLSRKKRA